MNNKKLYKQTLDQYNDTKYAKQYASDIADRLNEWLFDLFLPNLQQKAEILDIGCAAGRDSGYMTSRGFKVIGIDQTKALLDIAKEEFPNIEFVEGDFTKLSFRDGSFNGIWCRAALVHLPTQELVAKAIEEFSRVLKPNGVVAIITKSCAGNEEKTVIRSDAISDRERFFRFQEPEEFTEMIRNKGLEIISSKIYNESENKNLKIKRNENWLYIVAKKSN